jgi:Acyl-protein synthetase, LuxE
MSILLKNSNHKLEFFLFNYFCKKKLTPIPDLFSITNQKQFEKIALKVFRFQYENNLVYREFCDFLKTDVQRVKSLEQIPFLPIQFFKSHTVVSNKTPIQKTFTSSGTSGFINSRHLVTDVFLYIGFSF